MSENSSCTYIGRSGGHSLRHPHVSDPESDGCQLAPMITVSTDALGQQESACHRAFIIWAAPADTIAPLLLGHSTMRLTEKFELGLFAAAMVFIVAYMILMVVDPGHLAIWLTWHPFR